MGLRPFFLSLFTNCVEEAFSEVHILRVLGSWEVSALPLFVSDVCLQGAGPPHGTPPLRGSSLPPSFCLASGELPCYRCQSRGGDNPK